MHLVHSSYDLKYPNCDAYSSYELRRQSVEGGRSQPADGYFQYINVPAAKEYEFGFNRGDLFKVLHCTDIFHREPRALYVKI